MYLTHDVICFYYWHNEPWEIKVKAVSNPQSSLYGLHQPSSMSTASGISSPPICYKQVICVRCWRARRRRAAVTGARASSTRGKS
ncbi:unnamed protein product [Urochloa humidicola]